MSKKAIPVLVSAGVCACIAGAWLLLENATFFPWQIREVQRIPPSDGKLEAVVLRGDAGAMTSAETYVAIVPSGGRIRIKHDHPTDTIFDGYHLKDFEVKWAQPKLLEIRYTEARIDKFKNYWDNWQEARGIADIVEIRLSPASGSIRQH